KSFDISQPDFNTQKIIENLRKNFEEKVALCLEYLMTKQFTELDQNQGYYNKCYWNINKLTLPNDPKEESSNSFIVTTKIIEHLEARVQYFEEANK
ncbi:12451_t:CDS:2, partial [Gigaspora margarita]